MKESQGTHTQEGTQTHTYKQARWKEIERKGKRKVLLSWDIHYIRILQVAPVPIFTQGKY